MLTTCGLNGGSSDRDSNLCQSIDLKNGCSIISPRTQNGKPNLIDASFSKS